MIEKLKGFCEKNNGKLISNEWLGNKIKHSFQFHDGNVFEMTPKKLLDKGWPKDPKKFLVYSKGHAKTQNELINELGRIAEKHNLKLISTIWLGNRIKYQFETLDGQIIEKTAQSLKQKVV